MFTGTSESEVANLASIIEGDWGWNLILRISIDKVESIMQYIFEDVGRESPTLQMGQLPQVPRLSQLEADKNEN